MKRSVPSSIYSRQYYLTINDGGGLARQDNQLSLRLRYMLDLAKLKPEDRVLDVGCGSGELCFAAASRAKQVVGIDYSKDAITLCDEKLRKASSTTRRRIRFIRTGAGSLRKYMKGERFTVIFLTDVVEHLYPEELKKLLLDLKEVLAPGGRVYIHTAPNLEFYRYGYPIIRFMYPLLRRIPPARAIIETKPNWKGRKRLPKDPEQGSHNKLGHVNEQTPRSLKETLQACGYRAKVKTLPFLRPVEGAKIRAIYFVLSLPILKKAFGADIVATAEVQQ